MPERAKEDRKPTLKDVAEKAGVSVMSASYAMRGADAERRVSEETRRRVLEAAKELSYRPDARARALRLGQTNIIGFYAGFSWIDVRNPYFAEVITGLQQGCESLGKSLLLHSFPSSAVSEEAYCELMDGRVDGLVVAMPVDDPVAVRLANSHLSVVAIADPVPGLPSVVVDDAAGGRAIADHLADLGHRNVVFASSMNPPTSAKRRQQSFIEQAVSRGMEVLVRSVGEQADLQEFVVRARSAGSAIVAWSDYDAHRILKACRNAGLSVPQDMAIVGFDGCPTSFDDAFPLTTVRAPWAEVAREAIQVLDRIMRNEPYVQETIKPVDLVRGSTT